MNAALALVLVLVAGCSSLPEGVRMSDAERAACAASGCSVWTNEELLALVKSAIHKGYVKGLEDGKQQASKGSI